MRNGDDDTDRRPEHCKEILHARPDTWKLIVR